MMIFISFIPQYFNQKAYADGLTQENLPPASVGNRQASLFVKVNPPFLTTDNRQDAYMQFRLFDANNNQTIQHVTYEITVTKGTIIIIISQPKTSSKGLFSCSQWLTYVEDTTCKRYPYNIWRARPFPECLGG